MGEVEKIAARTRWVAFAALVVGVVALCLAGYASFIASGNAGDLADHVQAEAGRIIKSPVN